MTSGWTKKTLGEVISLEYGKPLPNELRNPDTGFPVYGANGIKCFSERSYCDGPSIIIGRKGSAGAVRIVEEPFWPLDVTYYVKFDDREHDLTFLYHVLSVLDLPSLATGVKPGINRNVVYAIEQSFPPLSEQKRIVAILDEAFAGIDTAIANTEKNIDNASEVLTSYLNSAFSRPPAHWEKDQLKNICSIKHGFAFKSEFFARKGEYIVLTPGSFWERGGFRDQGQKTKYYTGEIPDDYVLSKGDFLVAMTEQAAGLLGSPLIVPESGRYLHNQRLGLVRPCESIPWNDDFFFHQFNTRSFRRSVQMTASGLKVRHTSPRKLGDVRIVYPPTEEEQARIASKINELMIESVCMRRIFEQKLLALKRLRESLLQKAFAGELTSRKTETEDREATA